MPRLRLLPLLAALAIPAVAATDAAARPYDVRALLADEVARLAPRVDVPIRLPATLDLDFDGAPAAFGEGTRRRYSFDLAGSPDCGGANACFLATLRAERGGSFAFRRTVRLARGYTGHYKPLTCGGSCSPPLLEWRQGGVLYGIQAKVGVAGARRQRLALMRAANSAIRAVPR